jgi:hypothetical protein
MESFPLLSRQRASRACQRLGREFRAGARDAFEAAWRTFLARRTGADFEEYRRERAFQSWKQAMWAKGLKLPAQAADGRAVCFCRRSNRHR